MCSHCGWLLLKCSTIGIGFNGAKTNFKHPTDEQLQHGYIFLATIIICSLSALNPFTRGRQQAFFDVVGKRGAILSTKAKESR